EGGLLVHQADHLSPLYPERCTEINGAGSGHVQPTHARQRLFSNEFPGGEKRDGGLFAFVRNDSEFCAARLKIEDRVSRTSLRKEGLLGLQLDDTSSHSCFFKEGGEIKGHTAPLGHLSGLSRMQSSRGQFGRVRDRFRLEVAGIVRFPSRVYKIIHLAVFVGADLCLRVFHRRAWLPGWPGCQGRSYTATSIPGTGLYSRTYSSQGKAAGGNAAPMPGAAARHQGEVCTIDHSESRRLR